MNSRIREAICLKTQPVAVIQTDHLPPRCPRMGNRTPWLYSPPSGGCGRRKDRGGVSSAHECLSGQQSWAGV